MAKFGFQAAEEEAKKQQNKSNTPAEYEKFTLTAERGPVNVRFVTEDEDKSVVTFTEHWVTFQCGWTRNYLCPNDEPGDDNCLICRLNAQDNSNKNQARTFTKNQRAVKHMINVIDRTDSKLKVWKFSTLAMAPIMPHFTAYGTVGDRDYIISLTENTDPQIKLKFIYEVEPATTKKTALSAEDKALIENRYNLEELMPKYDEGDIQRLIDRPAGDASSNGTTDTASKASAMLDNIFAGKKTATSMDEVLAKVPSKAETSVATATVESDEEAPAASDDGDFFSLLKQMNTKE